MHKKSEPSKRAGDEASNMTPVSNEDDTDQNQIRPQDWTNLIEKLHVRGLEKQLAQQSELLDFNDKTIELRCESRTLATSPIAVSGLEKRLNAHFTDQVRHLKVHLGSVAATPARERAKVKAIELDGAQKVIAEDSTVNALIHEFDGMLIPSSVQAT